MMISIIICSRKTGSLRELEQNIAETVGFAFETVFIDNSENKYSIFEAYNEGVRRAKGEILCFMHDDVLFRSSNWGNAIMNHFHESESIGLIWLCGSTLSA